MASSASNVLEERIRAEQDVVSRAVIRGAVGGARQELVDRGGRNTEPIFEDINVYVTHMP